MRIRWHTALVCVVLGLAGCVSYGHDGLAFRNPFDDDRAPDTSKMPPASTLAATRVIAVGKEIVAQNKEDLGVTPVFFTMGVREVEISHAKSGMVILSEGLVDRCPTDAELAAVICHELGKLAAEHGPRRTAEMDAAPAPRMTPDVVGGGDGPDQTRLAGMALLDHRGPGGSRSTREPKRDPRALGENFYVKTGRKAEDFARMDQLIREAEDNADRRASDKPR
jgi:Peptidase family M48